MKKLLLFFCLLTTINAISQTETQDKKAILSVLKAQEKAWNQFDLEGYMLGYWKSDSLKFYGSSGLTKIEENSYHVMGQYHLVRNVGNANGVFLIIFRKIDGEWRIVADMSC